MSLFLDFLAGSLKGQSVELTSDWILIGSDPSCKVCLTDEGVAARHCVIEKTAAGYRVVDFSAGTTRVGDKEIKEPLELEPGDQLQVGSARFNVRFQKDTAADATIGFGREAMSWLEKVRAEHDQKSDPGVDDSEQATLLDPFGKAAIPDTEVVVKEEAPPPPAPKVPEIRKPSPVRSPVAKAPPPGPRTPDALKAITTISNPTQVWELIGNQHFVIERPDTSTQPIEVPDKFKKRARFVFIAGPHQERQVYLGDDEIVFGRGQDNEVVLHEPLAAIQQFKVTKRAGEYRLEPLGKTQPPTICNGNPLTAARTLLDGDLIAVGASVIEFKYPIFIGMDAPGGTLVVNMPRFSFRGDVLQQPLLSIGRDPSCDLFLDDDDVQRRHAEILFDEGKFILKDLSLAGVFVEGKRIVTRTIADGDVAHIAEFQLKFSVEGARCNIDIAEPAIESEKFAADVENLTPHQTLYRLALPADANPTRKPGADATAEPKVKKKKKRGWAPPRDVEKTPYAKIGIATAVIASLVVVASAAKQGTTAFLRRPISAVHSSTAFTAKATETLGSGDTCSACHEAFTGALAVRCQGCHEDHELRPLHGAIDCKACHSEHRQSGLGPALVSGERCARCHDKRHEKLLPMTAGPLALHPPQRAGSEGILAIRADLAFGEGKKDALHEKHASIEGRCAGCHANQDQTAQVENVWSSCMRCHGPEQQLASNVCSDCHREHGPAWAAPAPQIAKTKSPIGGALATLLLLLLPIPTVLSSLAFVRTRREERAAEQRRKEEEAAAAAAPAEGKLIHNINLEKCVGCASCVKACPNDVLALEPKRHKSTVVRFDDCKQCRACEQICPSGALTMAPAGAPPRMIELPDLDANYQTNIPGIYLIGEAAGKSLVKNANNLGFRVVQHMKLEGVAPGSAEENGVDVEVIMVGSGPGGLSAGITCFNDGLKHIIFEKDRLAFATIQTYPKKKELLAEPPEVANIGPLPVWDSYKEEVLEKWFGELKKYQLDIRCSEEVREIAPLEGKKGFKVTTSKGSYTSLRVVLATGTRGNPRRLAVPGADKDKVAFILIDADTHNNQDVMVCGGGDSAVEAAIAIANANNGSNRVSMSYRKASFDRIKDRNRESLDKAVAEKRITLYLETNPVEIKDDSVVLKKADGSTFEVPNHGLYCMLGADPPVTWLQKIGVQYVKKPENWSPGASDDLSFLELRP
jgi:thioredoxin reductase (NADPH)